MHQRDRRPGLVLALLPAVALLAAATPAAAQRVDTRLAATDQLACGSDLLGTAQGFNVFVRGDYLASNTDVTGRVAAGGNASIDSYGVGSSLPPAPSRIDLIVGGNLTVGNGGAGAHNGSVTYGGTLIQSRPNALGALGLAQANPPFSFADAFSQLAARSSTLAARTSNGTITGPTYGALVLQGSDASLDVFSLSASDLQKAQVIRLRVPVGATTLINVSGSSFTTTVTPTAAIEIWDGSSYQQAGDQASAVLEGIRTRLLWNFPAATSVQIGPNLAWQGTVLAPNATISFASGQLNGSIIGASLTRPANIGSGEAHNHPFVGCVPLPAPVPHVRPYVTCVELGATGSLAHFGYENSESASARIAVGDDNSFSPGIPNRSQPEAFDPGRHDDAVNATFSENVTWHLGDSSATASASSPRCEASLRVDKALQPANDSGRFDLLLNGLPVASAIGNGGSSGTLPLTASPSGTRYTVSEAAALGSTLSDYDAAIVCRADAGAGAVVAQGVASTLAVTLQRGQSVVCVIANVRHDVIPPPQPQEADLAISKSGARTNDGSRTVLVGDRITWTITLTNRGPDAATNVVVEDALPSGVAFVTGSLSIPQGVHCTGPRCFIDSLANGETVSATFETTATQVGTQINTVTAISDVPDLHPAENVASAAIVVGSDIDERVIPSLECVEHRADGSMVAHLGYTNEGNTAVALPIARNAFTPAPEDRGQPTVFETGSFSDAFQVAFTGELGWWVAGRTVRADGDSPACSATIRVDKVLVPADDPGRFDLTIDGVPIGVASEVGDLGSTGDYRVAAAPQGTTMHTVGELGPETTLQAYETTIVCRNRDGAVVSAFDGPRLVVPVTRGASVVCTISNTRRSAPSPEVPTPLVQTPLPPAAPTVLVAGTPGTADLRVTETAASPTVAVEGVAAWSIVVTNVGTMETPGSVLDISMPRGVEVLALTTEIGTCTKLHCAFGLLLPAQTVRVTVRTRMHRTGASVSAARVAAATPLVNLEDDVSSAVVRVTRSYDPPLATRCGTVSVSPGSARAGKDVTLLAHVANAFGAPLAGARVQVQGAGVVRSLRTNGHGTASARVRPGRAGAVSVRAHGSELRAATRRCSGAVRVLRAHTAPPRFTG